MKRALWLVIVIAGTCVLSPALAHADTLGQTHQFFTNTSYDAAGASQIPATLRAVGQTVYIYVDDRYFNSLSLSQRNSYGQAVQNLANQFDAAIHPRSIAFWGPENSPGVDGDPHVTILLEQLVSGSGGYFQTINGYPPSQAPGSNGREMFYVSADSVGFSQISDFIAHEFQHLISFNQKNLKLNTDDDVWINEARSEYNITVTGLDDQFGGSSLQRRMQAFLRAPSDSVVEWPNTSADYALAAIFGHYLADQLGGDVMANTIHTVDDGTAAIDSWLVRNGSSERFNDVFTDWMVASSLNDRSVESRYGYARQGLSTMHVAPQQSVTLSNGSPLTLTAALKEWQPYWLRFNIGTDAGSAAANFQINGQGGPWWGGAAIATYGDGHSAVVRFSATGGQGMVSVPIFDRSSRLSSVTLAVSQGTTVPVGDRIITSLPLSVSAAMGDFVSASPTPTPVAPTPSVTPSTVHDGDLIRHGTEPEIYVIWGPYRRLLPPGVLKLYGFENRPIISVSNEVFDRYRTSIYIRSVNGTKVYAAWSDGTKHWLHITAAQWDASGRDWNAIFIVNDSEVAFYQTGVDITR